MTLRTLLTGMTLVVLLSAEALKAFHTVLETDSSCAMGYWGIAVSLLGNPLAGAPTPQALQEGAAILHEAKPVGVQTEREYAYLSAIALFYKDVESTAQRTRALAYEQAMEQLVARYPDDTEAAVFYALALLSTAPPTDKTYANQLKAAAILEKVFVQQPRHPGVAHYLIHKSCTTRRAGSLMKAPRGGHWCAER